jgi:hypothetical protein
LIHGTNDSVLEELSKGFPGLLEHISGLKIRTCLLAQAALNKGIVGFYTDLLRVSENTNEVYTHPVPPSAAGMSFRDYAALVLQSEVPEPVIPVGLRRTVDGRVRVYTNPWPGQEGSLLQEDDELLLIAYQPPGREVLPIPELAAPPRAVGAGTEVS